MKVVRLPILPRIEVTCSAMIRLFPYSHTQPQGHDHAIMHSDSLSPTCILTQAYLHSVISIHMHSHSFTCKKHTHTHRCIYAHILIYKGIGIHFYYHARIHTYTDIHKYKLYIYIYIWTPHGRVAGACACVREVASSIPDGPT